ncbi:tetratricopeptide repeat protein [Alkalihalobacillus sp. FSL W8-0930]
MSQGIPSVIVGSRCLDWYHVMIQSDFEASTRLKNEVTEMIHNMESDPNVTGFYELLSLRHNLLVNQISGHSLVISFEGKNESYLKYMYNFISGQQQYYDGKYTSAVRLYNKAEALLEFVEDQYERAEFFLRLADGYYRINQYLFAVTYVEQAMELFEQNPNYQNKVLNGHLLLAAIDSELGKYDQAEVRYYKALYQAEDLPKVKSLILRSLGLNRLRQHKYEEAKSIFIQALSIKEHLLAKTGNKTKADLAFIHLRLGEVESGQALLKEIEEWTQQDNEYHAKMLIYQDVFIGSYENGMQKGFEELIQHQLYFDAEEIALELVNYYQEREQFSKALYFSKLALKMNVKNHQLGMNDNM